MTYDLRVDHGRLDLTSTDLVAASRALQGVVSDLQSQLDRRQASWTGSAKEAYLPARATWTSAITEMQELLADIGRAVDRSNVAYREADLRGARLFG